MNTHRVYSTIQKVTAGAFGLALTYAPRIAYGIDGGTGNAPTATTTKKLEWTIPNPIMAKTLEGLIIQITNAMVLLMSPVIIIMLIYSGFLFVQGANDPKVLDKAKSTLKYTIIGAAIILGAKGLALVIQSTVNQL